MLTARLSAISSSLSPSLARHSVQTHADILGTLLDHARSNLVYEKQRLKEFETLRSEMKNIRKLEGGVVYHHDHSQVANTARANVPPVMSASPGQRNSSATSASMSPSPSTSSATSRNRQAMPEGDPLSSNLTGDPRNLNSMAQKAQKRTVRSMASSVVVEGDRRQRVDVSSALASLQPFALVDATLVLDREQARMAASMLANGF